MPKIIEEFTREEYQLLYDSFKHFRCLMSDEQEVLSEKILDKVFYPSFDKLKNVSEPVLPKLDIDYKDEIIDSLSEADYSELLIKTGLTD